MATITSFFTEEELQRMDSLVYRARQHGQSTLAHERVLPCDSDYQMLLVDAADGWFARQPRSSLSGRGVQIYDHARYTKNQFDGLGAIQRHLQRLDSSPPASTIAAGKGSWSRGHSSAHTQAASFLSAHRPSTSSMSTRMSAQPTTVVPQTETDSRSSVKSRLSQSLPRAGGTQKSTQSKSSLLSR